MSRMISSTTGSEIIRFVVSELSQLRSEFNTSVRKNFLISNMVLIQNEPYHKVLTNYQNSVMKDMNEGDIIVVAWPQPNGNIYPITH